MKQVNKNSTFLDNVFISIKTAINMTVLNFKYLFSSLQMLLSVLFVMFLTIIIPIIFVSFSFGSQIMMEMLTIIITTSLFGGLYYNLKLSSLYGNVRVNGTNRYVFYFSLFITTWICITLALFVVLGVLTLLNDTGSLLVNGIISMVSDRTGNGYSYFFFNRFFGQFYYSVMLMFFITFAISFFISRMSGEKKFYFVIMLSLLIACIFFGGLLNNYFYKFVWKETDPGVSVEGAYMVGAKSFFPEYMFIPSLLFPYFSPGELVGVTSKMMEMKNIDSVWYYSVQLKGGTTDDRLITAFPLLNEWTIFSWHSKEFFQSMPSLDSTLYYQYNWWWNAIVIMPWIHFVLFTVLGVLFSERK